MARKETVYVVDVETNSIIRASYTLLAALNFAATIEAESCYICTSEFQDMKKGDTMSNVVDFL